MKLLLALNFLRRPATLVGGALMLSVPLALAQAPKWPDKIVRIVAVLKSIGFKPV